MNPLISLFVFMFRRSLKSPKTQASSEFINHSHSIYFIVVTQLSNFIKFSTFLDFFGWKIFKFQSLFHSPCICSFYKCLWDHFWISSHVFRRGLKKFYFDDFFFIFRSIFEICCKFLLTLIFFSLFF